MRKIIPVEFAIILTIILIGVLLQLLTGPFPFALIAFPVNLIVILLVLLVSTAKPTSFTGRYGSLPISIFLIILITIEAVVMGLMSDNFVKDSWPFVLTYFMLVISLALAISRRLRHFKVKDTGFMLNHIGLFILLVSAGLGSADSEHYVMKVYEGTSENIAEIYGTGEVKELPFEISLINFKMERYQSKTFQLSGPKSFSSDIILKVKGNRLKTGTVKVNQPMKYGSWRIYQFSYNVEQGNDSDYSVFKIIYDPWLIPALLGIFMLFAGAISLFWKGGKP